MTDVYLGGMYGGIANYRYPSDIHVLKEDIRKTYVTSLGERSIPWPMHGC